MVKQLDDLCSEAWGFQSINELRNHTSIRHIYSDGLIKGEVEESTKSNLEKKSVVAGDKSVKLLDDSLIFHFVLVFSENAELFKEVQNDE